MVAEYQYYIMKLLMNRILSNFPERSCDYIQTTISTYI